MGGTSERRLTYRVLGLGGRLLLLELLPLPLALLALLLQRDPQLPELLLQLLLAPIALLGQLVVEGRGLLLLLPQLLAQSLGLAPELLDGLWQVELVRLQVRVLRAEALYLRPQRHQATQRPAIRVS